MKFFYSFSLSAFLLLFVCGANAQTWTQITNLSGTTQNYGGTAVAVSSAGSTSMGGGQCLLTPVPYWAGQTGPGTYTFSFNTAVSSVRFLFEGLSPGEYASVAINGVPVTLTDCNIVYPSLICGGGPLAVIENGKIYAPGQGLYVQLAPAGGIHTIDFYCNGSLSGIDFWTYFTADPTPVINGIATDNFYVCQTSSCNNSEFFLTLSNNYPNASVTTFFGDGQSSTAPISGNSIDITHTYAYPGTYTVKNIIYSGIDAMDSLVFSYDDMFCNNFAINYYLDQNGNCINDPGEIAIMQPVTTEVDSNGIPVDTVISASGIYYTAHGNLGDIYQFKVLSVAGGLQTMCPANGIVTDTVQPILGNTNSKDIGFICTGSDFDLNEYAILHAGRHIAHGSVLVGNTYCTPENVTLSAAFTPKYIYGDAYPVPASQIDNNITWNFSNVCITGISPMVEFDLNVPGAWLTDGDTVTSSYSVTPTVGDLNIGNNSSIIIDTVDGSWDPNHMSVSPSGYVPAGTTFTYFTEFENTGHDTAFNIHIMDTLSDNVDIHTLEVLASSAPMKLNVTHYSGHNVLKFDFPHINLPDSAHHGQCDGMVVFKINAKTNLPYGTTIFNHAGIFFDDNPVVMTDTVIDIITWPSAVPAVSNAAVAAYPNPASNELTVKADNAIYTSYTITNSVGQSLLYSTLNATQTKVDISKLPAGVYYISLKSDNGSVVKKFVKM